MNSNNRIGVDDKAAMNSDRTQSRTTLCGHFQRRKSMWIIFSIIVLAGLVVITPIIIVKTKTTNSGNSSTTEESTTDCTQTIITTTTTITTITTTTTITTITTTDESTLGIRTTTEVISTTSTTKITETTTKLTTEQLLPAVVVNTRWNVNASTVAGGNGWGDDFHQLSRPGGIYVVDEDRSIYVSDTWNHRIVQWKFGATNGDVVAGGNGSGSELDQLNRPADVIFDKKNNSLIICDHGNARVMKWYRGDNKNQQTMISFYICRGLAMDNNGDLYVSSQSNHEVRRWKQGETEGTIVAGGNEVGNGPHQLNGPRYIFVDEDYSIYVAEYDNTRVMKWTKDAKEGILVAGAFDESNSDDPHVLEAVIVDPMGNVYVSDTRNYQITRWSPGAMKGSIVAGGFRRGDGSKQLFYPTDLSFDRQGNLYVSDTGNNRIQKFAVRLN